jgi:hypothetical protein
MERQIIINIYVKNINTIVLTNYKGDEFIFNPNEYEDFNDFISRG